MYVHTKKETSIIPTVHVYIRIDMDRYKYGMFHL